MGCAPADRIAADKAAMLALPPVAPVVGWRATSIWPRPGHCASRWFVHRSRPTSRSDRWPHTTARSTRGVNFPEPPGVKVGEPLTARGTVLAQVRILDEVLLASATQPGVPRPPDEVGWAWRRLVRAGSARRSVSSRPEWSGVSVSGISPSGSPGRSGYARNGPPGGPAWAGDSVAPPPAARRAGRGLAALQL